MLNENTEINIATLAKLKGLAILEFGASWCPHCQAAQPKINAALQHYPHVQHFKIEDGKGKRLGRLYAVKLWPTLVFIKDGAEKNRLIRPQSTQEIINVISQIGII